MRTPSSEMQVADVSRRPVGQPDVPSGEPQEPKADDLMLPRDSLADLALLFPCVRPWILPAQPQLVLARPNLIPHPCIAPANSFQHESSWCCCLRWRLFRAFGPHTPLVLDQLHFAVSTPLPQRTARLFISTERLRPATCDDVC